MLMMHSAAEKASIPHFVVTTDTSGFSTGAHEATWTAASAVRHSRWTATSLRARTTCRQYSEYGLALSSAPNLLCDKHELGNTRRTAWHGEGKAQAITCETEEAVRELHASLSWWEFRLGTDFVEERVGQYLKSARQSCDAHS